MRFRLPISILSFLISLPLLGADTKPAREIRTYLPFSYPVDPAVIQIMPDFTISNALASSLVEWNNEMDISSGLAQRWKIVAPNTYRFELDPTLHWSDHSPITATEVKQSLERSLSLNAHELLNITQVLETIEIHSNREIDFKLKVPAKDSQFPEKISIPQFGIVKIRRDGSLDLSVSTGPYYLSPRSNYSELTLLRNPEWFNGSESSLLPEKIVIRRTPHAENFSAILLKDPWPNLIETFSIVPAKVLEQYRSQGFSIWKSPLNQLMSLQLGRRSANPDGLKLMRFLKENIHPDELANGLSGISPTTQIFPRGFQFHDTNLKCPKGGKPLLPHRFKVRPIDILFSPNRVPMELKENLQRAIMRATGLKPNFIPVPLADLHRRMTEGSYDIYLGTIGVVDPDPERTLSFYFEGPTPLVYSTVTPFLKRFKAALLQPDQNRKHTEIQGILKDALCEGNVLPLFHLSTLAIARPEVDLSQIPPSEESVSLLKIRLKGDK